MLRERFVPGWGGGVCRSRRGGPHLRAGATWSMKKWVSKQMARVSTRLNITMTSTDSLSY